MGKTRKVAYLYRYISANHLGCGAPTWCVQNKERDSEPLMPWCHTYLPPSLYSFSSPPSSSSFSFSSLNNHSLIHLFPLSVLNFAFCFHCPSISRPPHHLFNYFPTLIVDIFFYYFGIIFVIFPCLSPLLYYLHHILPAPFESKSIYTCICSHHVSIRLKK